MSKEKELRNQMAQILGGDFKAILEVDTAALCGEISLDDLYRINDLGLSRRNWYKLYHQVVAMAEAQKIEHLNDTWEELADWQAGRYPSLDELGLT